MTNAQAASAPSGKLPKPAPFVYRFLVWLSCGLNWLLGGSPYMTFSVHQHIRWKKGQSNYRGFVNALFFWETDHCADRYGKARVRYRTFAELDATHDILH